MQPPAAGRLRGFERDSTSDGRLTPLEKESTIVLLDARVNSGSRDAELPFVDLALGDGHETDPRAAERLKMVAMSAWLRLSRSSDSVITASASRARAARSSA